MFANRFLVLAICTFGTFLTGQSVAADVPQADLVAKQILEETWATDLASRRLADAKFNDLRRNGRPNADSVYAYLLAKVRQNDIEKAIAAADLLLEVVPEHLGANHARCWLLMLTKEPASALATLKNFAQANREDKSIDDLTRTANMRAIGRMFGYLQGPMSTRVARAELDRARGDILKDTDEELVEQFDVERKFVLTMHEKIVADKVDVDTTNREQKKEEQEKALAELKEKIEDLEKAEDELSPKRDQIAEEGEKAISEVQQKFVPLESQLSQLTHEASSLQSQVFSLLGDARYFEQLALQEPNPRLRDSYFRRADQAAFSASRIDVTLANVERQIGSVNSALAVVQRELQATQQRFGAKLDSINRELRSVADEQRKTEGRKSRASRPVRTVSARGTSLKNRATRITTYEQFPVEHERGRLLERIKERTK